MTKAADVMSRDVITVKAETSLRDLAEILSQNNINGVPVIDDAGELVGVVCESDLVERNKPLHIPTVFFILDSIIPMENPWRIQKEFKRLTSTKVEDIYSSPAISVNPDTDITEVACIMSEKKIHTLPVVDRGKLVGVVGKGDVIRSLI